MHPASENEATIASINVFLFRNMAGSLSVGNAQPKMLDYVHHFKSPLCKEGRVTTIDGLQP